VVGLSVESRDDVQARFAIAWDFVNSPRRRWRYTHRHAIAFRNTAADDWIHR